MPSVDGSQIYRIIDLTTERGWHLDSGTKKISPQRDMSQYLFVPSTGHKFFFMATLLQKNDLKEHVISNEDNSQVTGELTLRKPSYPNLST